MQGMHPGFLVHSDVSVRLRVVLRLFFCVALIAASGVQRIHSGLQLRSIVVVRLPAGLRQSVCAG